MKTRLPFLFPVLIGAGLACAGPVASRGETPLPTDDEIRQMLRGRIDDEQLGVGIVVGLIDETGATRIVSYGTTAPGGPPVDGRTIFEIGSVTKVFTATLLAAALERGAMKLNDPASRYLPPEMKLPVWRERPIMLFDLATQSSGLPRMPANFHPADPANPYADYTPAQLAEFLAGYKLTREPGSQFEYSNLGFGVLGQALTHAAGTDYATLVRRDICDPLQMPDTTIALTPDQQARLAKPFGESLDPAKNWDLPTLAGAGALRSDAADMLRFVAANLGYIKSPLAEAMRLAREPLVIAGRPETRIGLAWFTTYYGHEQTLTWHNGATAGYRAYVGLDLKKHRGVVVLANSGNDIDDLGRHLLDPQSPLTPPAPVPITLPPVASDPYVGSYVLSPDFAIEITRRGPRYFLQATGQEKARLFPQTPTLFTLKVVDAQISFAGEQDGKYQSLVLHQNGLDKKGPRLDPSRPRPTPQVRATIALPPEIGDRYVGRYEVAPGFVLTVTREGDRYFAQATGQGKDEIFPETETDFFLKAFDAQLTFVKDAAGNVTSVVLHQGGDQTAKRLP